MFDDIDPGDHTPASLAEAYRARLVSAIETAGIEAVCQSTDLDRATVEALSAGDLDELTLSEAAAVLATADGRDDDTLLADARDRLLLAMSSAVMDVDALSRALDRDVTPKELQQQIEGRQPITVDEYAELSAVVAGEQ